MGCSALLELTAMSDAFSEILEALAELHRKAPGLRFGQVLGNSVDAEDLYYTEDWQIRDAIKRFALETRWLEPRS